jgi:hypothetical protein
VRSVCLARQLSRRVAILSSGVGPHQRHRTKVDTTLVYATSVRLTQRAFTTYNRPPEARLATALPVTAGGTSTANNVVLTDALPSGLKWTIAGPDDAGKCSPSTPVNGGMTLTCQFGDLSPGSTRTITLAATASPANCPSISNTANVSAVVDNETGNNSSGPVVITLNGCSGVVRGKTKGFWGNKNGHGVLDPGGDGRLDRPSASVRPREGSP